MTSCLLQEVLVVILYHALPFFILVLFLLVNRHFASFAVTAACAALISLMVLAVVLRADWLILVGNCCRWFELVWCTGWITDWITDRTDNDIERTCRPMFLQPKCRNLYMLIWFSHYYGRISMLMMESCIFLWFDRTPCPTRPPIQSSVSSTPFLLLVLQFHFFGLKSS